MGPDCGERGGHQTRPAAHCRCCDKRHWQPQTEVQAGDRPCLLLMRKQHCLTTTVFLPVQKHNKNGSMRQE